MFSRKELLHFSGYIFQLYQNSQQFYYYCCGFLYQFITVTVIVATGEMTVIITIIIITRRGQIGLKCPFEATHPASRSWL